MDFERAFKITIGHEGGYVNDPDDPGGETKYGISARSYPHLDIKKLTLGDASVIYRDDFWDPCKCDELPAEVRLILFDSAVNQGPGTATKLLQKSLKVRQDGIIGPVTIGRAAAIDGQELALDYLSHRAVRYTKTNNFYKYGRGWLRRLFSIAKASRVPQS